MVNFTTASAVILAAVAVSRQSTVRCSTNTNRRIYNCTWNIGGIGTIACVMKRSCKEEKKGNSIKSCTWNEVTGWRWRNLLGWRVGTHNVLDFVSVRVQKSKGRRSKPNPIARLGTESVHDRHDLTFQFENLLKTFFHMIDIFWVEKIETNFPQQLWWWISEQVKRSLINKSKFSVGWVTRNKF